jgi:molybdenum cofactor cytidylyltransferase
MSKTAGIILAAGASSRMGKAKQLLNYEGESMIERIIRIAKLAELSPIIVVIGARLEAMQATLSTIPNIHVVVNSDWETGMGSSVACGLTKALQLEKDLSNACFLLTDQPHVNTGLIQNLKTKGQHIDSLGAVCDYGGTLGVPALFKRILFEDLLQLNGEKGAKNLINKHATRLASVSFPKGKLDLDYPEDWERFIQEK